MLHAFPDMHALLKLLLAILLCSALAITSFSAMRRIKTHLRASWPHLEQVI